MADEFTWQDITWHRPRSSYGRDPELLSAEDRITLRDCHDVVLALTDREIAIWICDLLAAKRALDLTLYATMDALHDALVLNTRLHARIRTLMGVEPDDAI